MALVVGLVLLLALTLLAVTAARGTIQQERMSANNQQQTETFQGAEVAIRRVMAELRGQILPPATATESMLIAALNATTAACPANNCTRSMDTGTNGLTTQATVAFSRTTNLTGFRMGVDSGSYVGYEFIINGTSQQAATNAFSNNEQGISRIGPRP